MEIQKSCGRIDSIIKKILIEKRKCPKRLTVVHKHRFVCRPTCTENFDKTVYFDLSNLFQFMKKTFKFDIRP